MFFIIFLILFILVFLFILACCAINGSDPQTRLVSDKEQLEYIRQWNKAKKTGSQ